MNKELKNAAEIYQDYNIPSERGINPISMADAHIVTKLTNILVQMDANEQLVKILRSWKKDADDDIYNMLEELELSLEEGVDGEMKKSIDFIEYETNILAVRSLFSIRRLDTYDMKGRKPVYKVLINESENLNVINSNIQINFEDSVDRDLSVDDLKTKLSQFTNIRFL